MKLLYSFLRKKDHDKDLAEDWKVSCIMPIYKRKRNRIVCVCVCVNHGGIITQKFCLSEGIHLYRNSILWWTTWVQENRSYVEYILALMVISEYIKYERKCLFMNLRKNTIGWTKMVKGTVACLINIYKDWFLKKYENCFKTYINRFLL